MRCWVDDAVMVHDSYLLQALIEMVNRGYTCDSTGCEFMGVPVSGGLMVGEVMQISERNVMVRLRHLQQLKEACRSL